MDQNNQNNNIQNNNVQNNGFQANGFQIPKEYKPISAWGYVGWDLLFGIPIAGFIVLLVFACGGCNNINLKKYARSKFCAALLALIIAIGLILTGVLSFSLLGERIKIR